MSTAVPEVDRFLTLLRNKIREQGFTQLQVQEALGWGRSYISQLLTKQKALRVEQVLLMLDVIGVEPTEFFSELYGTRFYSGERAKVGEGAVKLQQEVEDLRGLVQGLADLLLGEGLITSEDLSNAVERIGAPAEGSSP